MPWQFDPGDLNEKLVYHPEPILFVHGINDNDATWGHAAIPALTSAFVSYDVTKSMDNFVHQQTNGLNAVQQPYLHTFNYGDPPNASTHSRSGELSAPLRPLS